MKIGILSVQGAFIEHQERLHGLGASCIQLRKAEDLEETIDGLVLPGGESTVQRRLFAGVFHAGALKEKNRRRTARIGNLRRPDPSG